MFCTWMQNKRGLHQRLMIDKFIRFCRLKFIIEDKTFSVTISVYNYDFLNLRLNLMNNALKGVFVQFVIVEIIIYPIYRIFSHNFQIVSTNMLVIGSSKRPYLALSAYHLVFF